jgi:hypothetical protein
VETLYSCCSCRRTCLVGLSLFFTVAGTESLHKNYSVLLSPSATGTEYRVASRNRPFVCLTSWSPAYVIERWCSTQREAGIAHYCQTEDMHLVYGLRHDTFPIHRLSRRWHNRASGCRPMLLSLGQSVALRLVSRLQSPCTASRLFWARGTACDRTNTVLCHDDSHRVIH